MIAGVMLPSYDFFKQTLLDGGLMGDTIATHFLASFLAGIIGTLVTNPVDVVKSRMMNQMVVHQHTQQRHFYTSSLDCLIVVSTESERERERESVCKWLTLHCIVIRCFFSSCRP